MRGALKTVALKAAFLEHLADAQTVFWKAVHEAAVAIAERGWDPEWHPAEAKIS